MSFSTCRLLVLICKLRLFCLCYHTNHRAEAVMDWLRYYLNVKSFSSLVLLLKKGQSYKIHGTHTLFLPLCLSENQITESNLIVTEAVRSPDKTRPQHWDRAWEGLKSEAIDRCNVDGTSNLDAVTWYAQRKWTGGRESQEDHTLQQHQQKQTYTNGNIWFVVLADLPVTWLTAPHLSFSAAAILRLLPSTDRPTVALQADSRATLTDW